MGVKVAKDKANYRQGDTTRNCANCMHMRDDGSCSVVAGMVKPDMVSDYYKAKR